MTQSNKQVGLHTDKQEGRGLKLVEIMNSKMVIS